MILKTNDSSREPRRCDLTYFYLFLSGKRVCQLLSPLPAWPVVNKICSCIALYKENLDRVSVGSSPGLTRLSPRTLQTYLATPTLAVHLVNFFDGWVKGFIHGLFY